jgi:hypothetical protein
MLMMLCTVANERKLDDRPGFPLYALETRRFPGGGFPLTAAAADRGRSETTCSLLGNRAYKLLRKLNPFGQLLTHLQIVLLHERYVF